MKASKLLGEIRKPNCMVQDPVSAIIVGIGATHNANHRQILTVSTSNGVQHAKPTDSESDHTCTHALGSSIAISGVAGVELVAAADQVEFRLGDQVIQKGQIEIPRNREHIFDSDLDEPPSEVTAERAA